MAKNTLIQKILDNHIVSGSKVTGEPVAIRIDQTLTQDATGTWESTRSKRNSPFPMSTTT